MDSRSLLTKSSSGDLAMNSNSLKMWQIEKLFRRVQQELHDLDRFEGRMYQKHFPANDPVFVCVKEARAAIHGLSIQLDHLSKSLPS
jgi:hypothetical protein